MDSPASVAVAAMVIGVAVWLWQQVRPRSLPPGPACLPVVGSVLSMTSPYLHLQIEAWRKKYGDILTVSFGSHHMVALNGYEVIKDALVGHSVEFAGKEGADDPRFVNYTPNFPKLGIFTSGYSEEWRKQRSMAMQILRKLGYSTSSLEAQIQEEACALRDSLADTKCRPTDPAKLLSLAVANVICSLLYGERQSHGDQEFQKFVHLVDDAIKYLTTEDMGNYIWLLSLRPSYKKKFQDIKKICSDLNKFNEVKFKERRDRLEQDGYSEPRDFIEHYMCEFHKDRRSTKMAEDWLHGNVNDFFLAGTESASTILNWGFLFMATKPDVQDKVYAELSRAMEVSNGEISLSLRDKCPYVEATIMELLRIRPLSPLAPHTTTADVKFHGYSIPKDTGVFINLHSVVMDPEHWPDPKQFRPERHLDVEGDIRRDERWIPFSMGRRSCLGEQLSRRELFLFFATTVSSFRIRLPEGHTPNLEPPPDGFGMAPYPYDVIFEPRG